LSVYQRGSLLDGLAMYLSCDTKKFHDNESTHILHNFLTSTHRGEASLFSPLAAPLCASVCQDAGGPRVKKPTRLGSLSPAHKESCKDLEPFTSRSPQTPPLDPAHDDYRDTTSVTIRAAYLVAVAR